MNIDQELKRLQEGYERHKPPHGDPVMRATFALNWFVLRLKQK